MNNRFVIKIISSTLNCWLPVLAIIAYLLVFPGKIHNFTNFVTTASQGSEFAVSTSIAVSHNAAGEDEAITANVAKPPKGQPDSKPDAPSDSPHPDPDSQNKQYAGPFDPLIFQAAKLHQVDPALIKAVIMAESGYNPKALSKKGARGLMQLMPRTAKWLGVVDSFNPEHNINGGVRYLKQLLKQFDGDVELALAAYNAGSRNVRQYNGVPPFKATKFYITKVFKYYDIYKKQFI